MRKNPLKSIKVDYNTWLILSLWARRESRTVVGQLRYLVAQQAPADLVQKVEESTTHE